jgi:hypothetical protein
VKRINRFQQQQVCVLHSAAPTESRLQVQFSRLTFLSLPIAVPTLKTISIWIIVTEHVKLFIEYI